MPQLGEVVQGEPVVVERHEPLARTAREMYEQRVGSVAIVDEDGAVVGIFTERDLVRACAAGVDTHSSTVGNWMTEDPVTASSDTDAAEALELMMRHDFRHLPVIGPGGLLGVVSLRSLTRALRTPVSQ